MIPAFLYAIFTCKIHRQKENIPQEIIEGREKNIDFFFLLSCITWIVSMAHTFIIKLKFL